MTDDLMQALKDDQNFPKALLTLAGILESHDVSLTGITVTQAANTAPVRIGSFFGLPIEVVRK